jgi:signal transduction histidine kinase
MPSSRSNGYEDVEVSAIAGELRQVFSNLLANSLGAIDDKRHD